MEAKTPAIQRRVSGNEYNGYVFQGVLRTRQYVLIYAWSAHLSIADFNASGGQVRGAAYPVSDYAHAHLWRYLCDRYDEIKARADTFYQQSQAQADAARAARNAAQQQAQAAKQARADKRAADQAAEQSRIDRLFLASPQATPANRRWRGLIQRDRHAPGGPPNSDG